MNIKSPKQLEEAMNLAISGDKNILYDIGRYIAYNYYMHNFIKEGSPEDLENDRLYKEFRENHPELTTEVEEHVDEIFAKFEEE